MPTVVTNLSSVRDVVQRHPGAEQVFDRHGLAGCGGDNGPDEPIGFFAAIHHVDVASLVDELNAFIAETETVSVPLRVEAAQPAHTFPIFLISALLLTLVFGLTSGVAAALSDSYNALPGDGWSALVQAHGHLQLFGFLGLFIMGMAFHIVPRFKASAPPPRRLVFTTFGLVLAGVLLRANTQPHGEGLMRWLFAASGLIELGGVLLFAGLIGGLLVRARGRWEPSDSFLVAASGLLVLALGMNAYQVIDAARMGERVVDAGGDAATLEVAIHGTVLLFIAAVSFRVLPFFMRLRPAHTRLRDASLALLVAAVLARAAGLWAPAFTAASWPDTLVHGATAGEIAAILGLVTALRVFERALPGAPEGAHTPWFGTMVRTAYVWLVAAAGLETYWLVREIGGSVAPYYAAGALRHAVMVGLATTMLVAMSYRTVPVFTGRALPRPRAVPVVFALVVGGAALRVFPVVFVDVPSRLDYYLLGAGGAALFAGLAILTLQLWPMMFDWRPWWSRASEAKAPAVATPVATPAELEPAPAPQVVEPQVAEGRLIRNEMTVADALKVRPAVLNLLIEAGFQPLSDPATRAAMAPTITLERAAGVIGVPPQQLVDYLNLVLNASDPAPTESGVAPFDLDLVDSEVTREETVDALSQCYDPEIPVNIVELGLVYGVKVHEHSARAAITLTSPQCPAGDTLVSDVEQALLSLPGVTDARAKIMQEPRWSMARVSRAAKEALGLVGAR